MDCPYMDFWFDGNYGCELTGGECEGLLCDIASEFKDDQEDGYPHERNAKRKAPPDNE